MRTGIVDIGKDSQKSPLKSCACGCIYFHLVNAKSKRLSFLFSCSYSSYLAQRYVSDRTS